MATYSAITTGQTDAESPLDTVLASQWTNNLLAVVEGDATAPKIPWIYISSGTVSAAASLDIADLTTDFRAYALVFDDLTPATDSVSFSLRTSTDNGSTFTSTAASYGHSRCDTAGLVTGVSDTTIELLTGGGNLTGEIIGGLVYILNPMDSGGRTRVLSNINYVDATSTNRHVSGGGNRAAAEANDAIRFFFSAGNIATMNYSFYGIRA